MVAALRSMVVMRAVGQRRRAVISIAIALVAAISPGCTGVSVALSPITGPIDAVRAAIDGDIPCNKIWVVPFLVVLSPIAGLISGLKVDEAIVTQGRWDVIPLVLRPWNTTATPLPPLTAESAK
jgi:hypothetical protein